MEEEYEEGINVAPKGNIWNYSYECQESNRVMDFNLTNLIFNWLLVYLYIYVSVHLPICPSTKKKITRT